MRASRVDADGAPLRPRARAAVGPRRAVVAIAQTPADRVPADGSAGVEVEEVDVARVDDDLDRLVGAGARGDVEAADERQLGLVRLGLELAGIVASRSAATSLTSSVSDRRAKQYVVLPGAFVQFRSFVRERAT